MTRRAAGDIFGALAAHSGVLNTRRLTTHEFFVKKFERAVLQAVEYNRLRRFGRWHEFF